jgi:hypothetical protein
LARSWFRRRSCWIALSRIQAIPRHIGFHAFHERKRAVIATYAAMQHHHDQDLESKDLYIVPRNQSSTTRHGR